MTNETLKKKIKKLIDEIDDEEYLSAIYVILKSHVDLKKKNIELKKKSQKLIKHT